MSSDASSQFRITVWPQSLPHPGYSATLDYEFVAEAEAFVLTSQSHFLGDEPPVANGEAYLELCAVDLDDVRSIARFVRKYGPLEMQYGADGLGDPLEDYHGFYMHPGWPTVKAALMADYDETISTLSTDAWKEAGLWGVSTLSEFRYGARCMRDLVMAARVARGELLLSEATWESPVWDYKADEPFEEYPWTEGSDGSTGAEVLLELYLTDGLKGFYPRVITLRPGGPALLAGGPLWQTLCLELFNHLAAGDVYRSCENERCRRLFVRQSGRSQAGQYRTSGTKYCSSSCANAQVNRQYRRRKRVRSSDS